MIKIFGFLIITFCSQISSSKVKDVKTNDSKIVPIMSSLGRVTILQFSHIPKKVILGNSNYFNTQFNGTDVSIQPLSKVNSNLFVYTTHHRYGFRIQVCQCENYDDLVKVYWEPLNKGNGSLTERTKR